MAMRADVPFTEELKHFLLADAVLIFAFTLVFARGSVGAVGVPNSFVGALAYFAPMMAVIVTVSFILHELMHKLVAQRFGAIAGFRTSIPGLLITVATSLFGFLMAIPGATMIFAHNFTKKENGIVSIAGPLTNFVVFGAFFVIAFLTNPPAYSYLANLLGIGMAISMILAFFNMLPIMPLDGSKVLAWSPAVYLVTMGAIFAIIYFFGILPIYNLIFLVIIALAFSVFYRGMF